MVENEKKDKTYNDLTVEEKRKYRKILDDIVKHKKEHIKLFEDNLIKPLKEHIKLVDEVKKNKISIKQFSTIHKTWNRWIVRFLKGGEI